MDKVMNEMIMSSKLQKLDAPTATIHKQLCKMKNQKFNLTKCSRLNYKTNELDKVMNEMIMHCKTSKACCSNCNHTQTTL